MGLRAAEEIGLRLLLPHTQRHRMQRIEQRRIPRLFGADHQFLKALAPQIGLLPLLHRAETRHQPGLQRKGGEQLLAEAVDGLDAQAAAGRLQHAGEETAGILPPFGAEILAQRLQVFRQRDVVHLHPGGEAAVHALRHFRGARLGESQAEDIFRLHPAQQQAENAGGEHMGLARARRGGKPDMRLRRRSIRLRPAQPQQRISDPGHGRLPSRQRRRWRARRPGHTIPPAASTGRNRHSSAGPD